MAPCNRPRLSSASYFSILNSSNPTIRRQTDYAVNKRFTVPTDHIMSVYKNLLAYSMQQSLSWEANRFSASQGIPRILWNPMDHYRSHKCPPPVPILSQLDPVHTPQIPIPKIHFNIILQFTPGSPKWSLSFKFPRQNHVYASPLHHTCYMPRPSHSSRFYHVNNIGWGVQGGRTKSYEVVQSAHWIEAEWRSSQRQKFYPLLELHSSL